MSAAEGAATAIGRVAGVLRSSSRRRLGLAAGTAAAAALASGMALAAAAPPLLRASSNSTLHQTIVVDARGRTLYALSPETTRHLLCKSRACFQVWPLVTVRSRSVKLVAGHGVEGRLGLLRRSDGRLQVTLRGLPLYRFAGDSAKGQANGEGIKSFGGTWHAVRAKAHTSVTAPGTPMTNTSTTTTPTTMSTPPPPSYGY